MQSAVIVEHIAEECAELRAAQRDAGVGNDLDDAFEVELGGDRRTVSLQDLEVPLGLLAARRCRSVP